MWKYDVIAETDALTELYNRGAGEERVRHLMNQGKSGMFLVIDFDNFKDINDNYGHANGDIVLKTTAMCLRQSFRDNDVVMRFGGDAFAVFAQSLKSQEAGRTCIDRMMQNIHNLTIPGMPDYYLSVSVGIAFVDSKSSKTFKTVYRESDGALYLAKGKGKNNYAFFGENI